MTDDDEAARKDRLAQAQKLIDLFTSANGRPPRSPEEVKKWIDTPDGKAALADHQMPDGKIIPSRERFTPRRNGTVTTRGVRGERPPARSCRNISWQQGQGAQRSRVEGLSVAPRIGSHSPGHLLLSDCDVLVNETGAGLPTRGQAAHQSAERSPAFQRMLFNAKGLKLAHLLADIVAKRFCRSERARLIQDHAPMRNVDSKIHTARFIRFKFVFHSVATETFATISAVGGLNGITHHASQPF